MHAIEHNKHKAKVLFKQVSMDVVNSLKASYERDTKILDLKDLTNNDSGVEENLVKHMVVNYQMLTETYHFLQSLSKAYPWIDNLTFREKFVKQMDILGDGANDFNMRQFEVLLAQARFNRRISENYDLN